MRLRWQRAAPDATNVWDQALAVELLSGRLWPLPFDAEEHEPAPGEGGPVLAHGVLARNRAWTTPSPWSLVLHTSDEEQTWDSGAMRSERVKTWLNHAHPLRPIAHDRRTLIGWTPGTREALADMERKPSAGRALCGFAGQSQNLSRARMLEILRREGADVAVSQGFGASVSGLSRADYLRFLTEHAVVPCPVGNVSPDTMRLYEAIESGCVPIVERRFRGWPETTDFWDWTAGSAGPPPFPRVDSWDELSGILDRYRTNPEILQRDATAALAWWIGVKRQMAMDLIDDTRALGSGVDHHPVTIIIPTSPAPSHPSTAMIEDTVARLRAYAGIARADIIITVDGVRAEDEHRRADYEEYTRKLVDMCNWHPSFRGCWPIVFREHTHQVGMMREALRHVRTPLVFYVEHDTYPGGEVPFEAMIDAFNDSRVNVLRLHIFHEVIPDHRTLYSPEVIEVAGIPIQETRQWSQRPHLARADWYRRTLAEHFDPRDVGMIEDRLYGIVCDRPLEPWGIFVYAPRDGSMERSFTSDGRGRDPKHGMVYWINGERRETPGAPGRPE